MVENNDSSTEIISTELHRNSEKSSPKRINIINFESNDKSNESSDENDSGAIIARTKKRVRRFEDIGSDSEKGSETELHEESNTKAYSDSCDEALSTSVPQKSRIRPVSSSGSDTGHDQTAEPSKNEEQQSRIKNKRNKLRQKFKSLVSSRAKDIEPENGDQMMPNDVQQKEKSDSSSTEESSIDKIRQKIKERTMHLKSTIYDPDTSDEERALPKKVPRPKKGRKSAKLISPKPVRMSAKQAMENMQKIKSESNRMLREKEVSLPYHRPKALSLKDIMSRRRPAVTADGKALPIKMNEEQLKQYAQLLEQRQKEMMELCKSDTEEEDTQENEDKPMELDIQEGTSTLNDTLYDDLPKTSAENSIVSKVDDSSKHEDTIPTDIQMILEESNKEKYKSIDKSQDHIESKDKPLNDNPSIEITNALNNDKGENLSTEPGYNLNIAKENEVNSTADINTSTDMVLTYNDSVDENNTYHKGTHNVETTDNISKVDTEPESQLISLYYDSERVERNTENHNLQCTVNSQSDNKLKCAETRLTASASSEAIEDLDENDKINKAENNDFSDDDINMEDIDALIENAEIITSQSHAKNVIVNSPMLIGDTQTLKSKPKLTGAPGMVIDLDGSDPFAPKKLSGVELLKERFTFFANLKTPEEMERDREKMIKPGTQHQKLKHDLEEKIAEQRSLEWAKRLEDEKLQQKELDTIRGDDSDAEDDIEKIEAKLEENSKPVDKESSSESEDEEEDEIYEVKEKPVKRNPMIADEAEESDCDEVVGEPNDEESNAGDEGGVEDNDDESEVDSSDDDSESEDDQESKPKKGRILKAFEDSDDDTETKSGDQNEAHNNSSLNLTKNNVDSNIITQNPVIKDTQDDELQLAQMHKSLSADLFTSQESGSIKANDKNTVHIASSDDKELGTQTFSILDSTAKQDSEMDLQLPNRLTIVCNTQPYADDNLDTVAGMCSGSFTQNLVPSQFSTTHVSQTQESIGEDVLALCTGKFYDNQFVSQLDNDKTSDEISQSNIVDVDKLTKEIRHKDESVDKISNNVEVNNLGKTVSHETALQEEIIVQSNTDNNKQKLEADNTLKSILEELNDPEFGSPKVNKYFVSNDNTNKENKQNTANFKKKFIIESDDEANEIDQPTNPKKKKLKKRKLEDRALQISDDEEEDQEEEEEEEEYESEIEHENARVVEYDSEENEVEVLPQKPKKKRKMTEFFEQEAELTSEDEWVGSGDEDEAGLDRMEREAGDDDTFNQGRLQRELEQIHMRDVLDQDKREVRIIQELLFEDGDLGSGHRQRKFRWKNADGEEETGTAYSELADTQEEEFESEEQWRKQRHERETFLKQMQNQEGPDESLNVTVNRTAIIKANLSSRTMSSLLLEASTATTENTENNVPEKKTTKDVPSPKKPFTVFQQNYHGSLLTRGRGALARLAALATPLAADDDAPKVGGLVPSSKRNFVFAALTPNEVEPKVTKRKADTNIGTPRLVKKMKTEDQQKYKSRLLEILKP